MPQRLFALLHAIRVESLSPNPRLESDEISGFVSGFADEGDFGTSHRQRCRGTRGLAKRVHDAGRGIRTQHTGHHGRRHMRILGSKGFSGDRERRPDACPSRMRRLASACEHRATFSTT